MSTNVLKCSNIVKASDYEVGYRFKVKETNKVMIVTLDAENLRKIFRPVESKYVEMDKAFDCYSLDKDKVEELGNAIFLTRTLKSEGYVSSQIEVIVDAFDCGLDIKDFTNRRLSSLELEEKLVSCLRGDCYV